MLGLPAAWRVRLVVASTVALLALCSGARGQAAQGRYYAHTAVEDRYGVIAPWYTAPNGPWDWRIRIAAETLRRYPWVAPPEALAPAPHYIYNGSWRITDQGEISIPEQSDWANGDLGQRVACVIWALRDYYRYSGDPTALAHIDRAALVLVRHNQTPATHAWPRFPIICPTRGASYGRADPHGFIQLDLAAWAGSELVRAYKLTGNREWLDAARHWADVLAAHCDLRPGADPWPRYANPEDVPWGAEYNRMTGSVVFLVELYDELLSVGCAGEGGCYRTVRAAGIRHLRDRVLPRWTDNESFGLHYWDWSNPCGTGGLSETVATYLMTHPDEFPHWQSDVRNILTLHINHTGVSQYSNGDVYSGAWCYPESAACCGRSLWYGPLWLAKAYGRYGALTGSEWAREIQRRAAIMGTYDGLETGVVEDSIDGGCVAAGEWFNLAHPCALLALLENMVWRPEIMAPARENHLLDAGSIVQRIVYGKGRIEYTLFDAPPGRLDLLRLSYRPGLVTADGATLAPRPRLDRGGYTVEPLPGGDCLVRIRHDGARTVVIEGPDPQEVLDGDELAWTGAWAETADPGAPGRYATTAGAALSFGFTGNQFRIVGRGEPEGGLAEVTLDGRRELAGLDTWCPESRDRQVLYSKSGLRDGPHTVRVVVRGEGNPASRGTRVTIEQVQTSAATAPPCPYGEGGGPTETQRLVFGRTARPDYRDREGHTWRPGTEFVVRTAHNTDSVRRTWWTEPRSASVAGADDPELYRYGVHGRDFTVCLTVGPGRYHLVLGLAESRDVPATERAMSVFVNGTPWLASLDIAATAGGPGRATRLVRDGIEPVHGVVAVRFVGEYGADAIVQNLALAPGPGPEGARPVSLPLEPVSGNLLLNPGFEEGVYGIGVSKSYTDSVYGWIFTNVGEGRAYLWTESTDPGDYEGPGVPFIRSGHEAGRIQGDGDARSRLWQEVPVRPDALYLATAYAYTADQDGTGFGAAETDGVWLLVEELDAGGNVVATHASEPLRGGGATNRYVPLRVGLRTGTHTTRARFVIDSTVAAPWRSGHVTVDDCALLGPWPTWRERYGCDRPLAGEGRALVCGPVCSARASGPVGWE